MCMCQVTGPGHLEGTLEIGRITVTQESWPSQSDNPAGLLQAAWINTLNSRRPPLRPMA